MNELLILLLIFSPIVLWVWWMNKDQPQPKLDFGPTKEEHGWFYYVWNWKSYAAKIIWLVGIPVVWYQSDIGSAILWGGIGAALILLGKFWDLFKR